MSTSSAAGRGPAVRATAVAYATRPGDRRPLQEACRRLGMELLDVVREEPRGGDRPVLARALAQVSGGAAGCLVVRRLGDLDGGPGGLDAVLDRVEAGELRIVALDVGLDTAHPTGRMALAPRRDESGGPGRRRQPPRVATRCIGYACAMRSADEDEGSALRRHREAIESWCGERGLELVELVGDREPRQGKALERPGLAHAVRRLAAGDAGSLVVARLDHLGRSAADLGEIVDRLQGLEIRLVALDLGLDTAADGGAAAARALTTIGGWERERLSQRTRAGLRAADARRRAGTGPDAEQVAALRQRIAAMRADGMTLQAIADRLNAEGVPTQRGGAKWRPSSVQNAAGYRRPSGGGERG